MAGCVGCCGYAVRLVSAMFTCSVLRRFVFALVWAGKKNWRCLHAAHVYAVQTGAVQAARREGGAECGLRAAGCRAHGTGYRVLCACMLKGSF